VYDIIILDLWYHCFESMVSRTYDIIDLWYRRQNHRFWTMLSCMISLSLIYDIMVLNHWYQEVMTAKTHDIIDNITKDSGPWYLVWYHDPGSMISWSWIYDIKNLWYHRPMKSSVDSANYFWFLTNFRLIFCYYFFLICGKFCLIIDLFLTNFWLISV